VSEGIVYNDRVLVLGQTGSGKSELLNHLFSTFSCQRLLLDTKGGEWGVPEVEPTTVVEEIDWSAPIIHFVTQTDDPMEVDGIFEIARRRRHLTICVHEMCDLCNYSAQRTPPNVSAYLSKGRAHGLGLLGGSQRPVEMPVRGRSEVQHVFVVVPRMGAEDVQAISRIGIGIDPKALGDLIDQVEEQAGEHSFIWFRKGARGHTIHRPLPEQLRARTSVERRTPA
jgi:hypothetical protein